MSAKSFFQNSILLKSPQRTSNVTVFNRDRLTECTHDARSIGTEQIGSSTPHRPFVAHDASKPKSDHTSMDQSFPWENCVGVVSGCAG